VGSGGIIVAERSLLAPEVVGPALEAGFARTDVQASGDPDDHPDTVCTGSTYNAVQPYRAYDLRREVKMSDAFVRIPDDMNVGQFV
jgi:hypothetical protein